MPSSQLSLVPEPVVHVEYVPDEWGGSPVPSKPHFTATVGAWRGAGATEEDALVALAAELREHVEREQTMGTGVDPGTLAPPRQVLLAAGAFDTSMLIERLRAWARPATLAPDTEQHYAAGTAAQR